ncbi:MAG: DUF4239 domain-containing protein [Mycobacterium sp.]|uniref:bestrophin-like domain n=1 Tax=Mycobacterium sp. TaxID=1785 RepID=UPI003C790C45
MGGPLSPWLVLALIVAVAILVVVGSLWLGKRALPNVSQEHNSTLSPFLTIVGLLYGALLGFTVVASWQQFSSAQAVVAGEVSSLTTMYGQTVAMPEPEQTQMRQLLRQYASAVSGREWDKQGSGGTSDSARNAIIGMYRIVGSQPPSVASSPINGAFLNQLSVLASDRATRIIDANRRVPPLLWVALIFGSVVIVGLTGFLRLRHTLAHAVLSSTIAVLLGVLLCIIVLLNHPFGTQRGITPEPFKRSLQVFDAVDRGT